MKNLNVDKRRRLLAAASIAALAASGAVIAQVDTRTYVAPMATYVLADDDRNSDDVLGGTLAIGVPLSNAVQIELRASMLPYEGTSSDVSGGGLGINLFLKGPGGPYLHGDFMRGSESLFNVGLGWDYYLSKSFALRAEALYHVESRSDISGQDFKEPLFNLGFLIPIGSPPQPPPPPSPPPPPAVVAPLPPPPICADGLDNDGDGLTDFPDDPGCTASDDGDEFNAPAECKTPELGEAVNLEGCAVGDIIVLRGVNFDFDKSVLTVNARDILDGVAEALIARPDIEMELSGHTDSRGSEAYNASLSDRRARSVKIYLAGKGIDPSRMTTAGYGELQPVADNETDEGREFNRRVELKVTASSGAVVVAPPVPARYHSAEPESAPPPAADGGTSVMIVDYAYSPQSLTIAAGTTVTWTNNDGSSHFVKFKDVSSDRMSKGGVYSRTFTAPGSYDYQCTLHPSMTGTVVVQ